MLVVSKFVGGFATYDAMGRLLPTLSTAVAGVNTTRVVGDEIVWSGGQAMTGATIKKKTATTTINYVKYTEIILLCEIS